MITNKTAKKVIESLNPRIFVGMHGYLMTCAFLMSLALPVISFAQNDTSPALVIVVNINSSVSTVSDRELRKLFMGKSRKLPNGSRAVLASYTPISSTFNRIALARSDSEVTAAWSRLKFSGKTKPPREFNSPKELMAFIANTPNAIAYLPADLDLQGAIKTVRSLP